VTEKTISTSDREYAIQHRVESITIRLDPYELDVLEIKHMEGGDIAVIHNNEVEFSVMEEQP
jgi:flagellar hook-length control protein FliK